MQTSWVHRIFSYTIIAITVICPIVYSECIARLSLIPESTLVTQDQPYFFTAIFNLWLILELSEFPRSLIMPNQNQLKIYTENKKLVKGTHT